MASHLLTFQPRFADLVASGAKRQTIRMPRPWAVGDTLHLWEGDRTHKVRRLPFHRGTPPLNQDRRLPAPKPAPAARNTGGIPGPASRYGPFCSRKMTA